jgi:peptide/nickel transport system permease protein
MPDAAPEIPTEALWRIRLLLAWTTFQKNWTLFRSNGIGLFGLGIILMFGLMAVLHPILLAGLGPINTVGLYLLTWAALSLLLQVGLWFVFWLAQRLRLTTATPPRIPAWGSAVGAVVAVIVIGANLGNVWDSATYDTQVGTELDPPRAERVVVEGVTDSATEMSTREAVLYPDPNTGVPRAIGDVVVVTEQPAAPYGRHVLGTDPLGRDVMSQLMFGAQAAFLLGSVTALVTVFIATSVGAVAAYFSGWIDSGFMRFADLLLMLPALALLIVMSAVFDFKLWHLALFLGALSGFGGVAIVLKSSALVVTVKPFIDAARVAGGSSARVIFTHIVPNVMPLSFLYMMFGVTGAIQTEATLSFLGLLNIPMSWGIMLQLAQNQGYFLDPQGTWWLVFPAGLAITFISAAFFLVGRAMDEVINPRLRRR